MLGRGGKTHSALPWVLIQPGRSPEFWYRRARHLNRFSLRSRSSLGLQLPRPQSYRHPHRRRIPACRQRRHRSYGHLQGRLQPRRFRRSPRALYDDGDPVSRWTEARSPPQRLACRHQDRRIPHLPTRPPPLRTPDFHAGSPTARCSLETTGFRWASPLIVHSKPRLSRVGCSTGS